MERVPVKKKDDEPEPLADLELNIWLHRDPSDNKWVCWGIPLF